MELNGKEFFDEDNLAAIPPDAMGEILVHQEELMYNAKRLHSLLWEFGKDSEEFFTGDAEFHVTIRKKHRIAKPD